MLSPNHGKVLGVLTYLGLQERSCQPDESLSRLDLRGYLNL